jgi:hypothetical protein
VRLRWDPRGRARFADNRPIRVDKISGGRDLGVKVSTWCFVSPVARKKVDVSFRSSYSSGVGRQIEEVPVKLGLLEHLFGWFFFIMKVSWDCRQT